MLETNVIFNKDCIDGMKTLRGGKSYSDRPSV